MQSVFIEEKVGGRYDMWGPTFVPTPLKEVTDGADVNWSTHIVVVTKEGKKFEFSRDVVHLVGLVRDLVQDADEGCEIEVPLAEVDSETLQCIWVYLELHQRGEVEKLEVPLNGNLKDLVSEADWSYLTNTLMEGGDERKHEKLFNTAKGADFMNIESLRDLCCAAIANMFWNKSEEEVYHHFGVETPFTDEEIEAMHGDYQAYKISQCNECVDSDSNMEDAVEDDGEVSPPAL
eukprot:TRINITY_DN7444_c0_g1_i1.p1 TRINITY_DN7444_c0_g1~~TRINITY_DN7444_c0_g1_i1.p1  ORF type:complete len:234 (+),score=46.80 TRINITY_DN7444_c0_g1_i1:234-935(+)